MVEEVSTDDGHEEDQHTEVDLEDVCIRKSMRVMMCNLRLKVVNAGVFPPQK